MVCDDQYTNKQMLGAQPLAREAGKTEIHLISFISILRVFICHAKFGETYLEVCCCDAAFRVSINLQRSGAITTIRFMSWSTSKFCDCFWVIFAVRKWKPFSLEVVMPKFGSEPRFEPEPLGPNPKFGSRFRAFAEPNLRSSSRFSQS